MPAVLERIDEADDVAVFWRKNTQPWWPPLSATALEAGYKAMAADVDHEREAQEWCNALIGETLV
jgi:hypothetical protein